MADLKFAVLFSCVDQLSDKLSSMGEGAMNLGNRVVGLGEKISDLGENLTGFGERLTLDSMLMKEGAEQMRQWADAITEPAFAAQKAWAASSAMTGIAGKALDDLKEHALDFQNTHPGETAEAWASSFTQMYGVLQDVSKASAATDIIAQMSKIGIDGPAAAKLVSTAYAGLNVDANKLGDEIARMTNLFGAPDASQLAMIIGRVGGTLEATHTPLSQFLALAGQAQQMLPGRGMMMFGSLLEQLNSAAAQGKNDIDFRNGLIPGLQQLNRELDGLTDEGKIAAMKDMGVGGDVSALLPLLGNLNKVADAQGKIENSAGALGVAYKAGTADAADQITLLHQNVSSLFEAMSSPTLPWFTAQATWLTTTVKGLTDASEKHWKITSDAVIGLSALGNVTYAATSALSAFGTTVMFTGEALKFMGWLTGIADMETFALKAMYLYDAINPITIATKLWAVAQWGLNLAMGAGLFPILATVAAVAAVAYVAYEIYEHWAGIAKFFSHAWTEVKTIFSGAVTWMETAGLNMMKALGSGILAGIEWPFKATWSVLEKVGGLVKFHSPPKEGPLRDAVTGFHFTEALAQRITPSPILTAMGRTAGAIALAAPLLAAPGLASASSARVTSATAAGIVINAPITINAPNGDSAAIEKIVVRAFDRHRFELVRAVELEMARRDRTILK